MRALLLALTLLSSLPARADVVLIEAGVICPREVGGALVPAPETEAGAIRLIEQSLAFDVATRRVPLIDLVSFGVRLGLAPGAEATVVDVVITHPPIGPRGVTRQAWSDTLRPGEGNLNLFVFELEHEKVAGDWTWSVERAGETVLEVPFAVTPAGAVGAVEETCFAFLS